ncbi:phosphatase PAP2 family protein [Ekhidna sp.]
MYYIIPALLIIALLILNQKHYWKVNSLLKIDLKKDIAISILCVATSFISIELQDRKAEKFQKFQIGSLDQTKIDQINWLDRIVAGRWDLLAKDNGKALMSIAIYIIPLSLFLFRGGIKERLGLFFIFTQGYILTESVTGIVKGLTERYRPFAYRSLVEIRQLGMEAKEEFVEDISKYDIENSFFSGDAALTAFSLIFFAYAFQVIYSESKLRKIVWGFMLLGIVIKCYFRTMSGKHFPSDVMVGAVFGSVLAFFIIKLHLTKTSSLSKS